MPGLGRHCLEAKKIKKEMNEEGCHVESSGNPERGTGPAVAAVVAAAAAAAGCRAQYYSLTAALHAPADSVCMGGIREVALVVAAHYTENFGVAYLEKNQGWLENILDSEEID